MPQLPAPILRTGNPDTVRQFALDVLGRHERTALELRQLRKENRDAAAAAAAAPSVVAGPDLSISGLLTGGGDSTADLALDFAAPAAGRFVGAAAKELVGETFLGMDTETAAGLAMGIYGASRGMRRLVSMGGGAASHVGARYGKAFGAGVVGRFRAARADAARAAAEDRETARAERERAAANG